MGRNDLCGPSQNSWRDNVVQLFVSGERPEVHVLDCRVLLPTDDLLESNNACGFKCVDDVIRISLADGETTDYIEGKPFDVEGVFRIAPEADDTELYQLYRIADAKVLK